MLLKYSLFSSLLLLPSLITAQAHVPGCMESKSAMQQPPPYYSAGNMRSDTFNILAYTISLEIGSSSNATIGGNTAIRLAPKMNGRTFIRLDLLEMIVDSVKENNTSLSYTYNDTILKVSFTAPKNTTDTALIHVYYHGAPVIDQSGWGGFYFDNSQGAEYAYNLGVGFAAKPHNYGRVWFPCFDNFVEKSRYTFHITSDSARRAYCNGALTGDVIFGNKRTRSWVLNEEVPTYLVSVALAKYSQVSWTVSTLSGPKPIILAAHASDTNAVKNGFANLPSCVQGFENYFGPYMWNRVGYCMVPFNSGAMEHATSITYPRTAAGSLLFEDLMAHELSHHWWGNLVTCETEEDMWINEGWASFSAHLFYEWKYGKAAYLNRVKPEHEDLLHFLHKQEGGFRAISGVPHALTYSSHVYKKGAIVAHTLRGYMGDSAFFSGCKHVMQQKAYRSMNSNEFRDLLQSSSGQNLTHFFNNWVYAGGWPHFSVDSVRYTQNGSNTDAVVSVRQKLYGAPSYYTNVPLELSFFKGDWSREVKKVVMSGQQMTFTLSLPYLPVYCALNFDSRISDASEHEYKTVKAAGNLSFGLGKALLMVQNKGIDSSLVRIIHNYVAPGPFMQNTQGHRLSDQHYWRVEGIFSPGFTARIRLNYDGNKGSAGAYTYLDTSLAKVNGDSMGVFYRADASQEWQWLRRAFKQKTGTKTGYFEIDSIKQGEYAFGNLGDTLTIGIRRHGIHNGDVRIFPNPAGRTCRVEVGSTLPQGSDVRIISIEGKTVLRKKLNGSADLDLTGITPGSYTLQVSGGGKPIYTGKLVIE
jgi:hypothetical protein